MSNRHWVVLAALFFCSITQAEELVMPVTAPSAPGVIDNSVLDAATLAEPSASGEAVIDETAPAPTEAAVVPEPTPDVAAQAENEHTPVDLPSPTQNLEAYQEARTDLRNRRGIPSWGMGFDVAARPFQKLDLRAPETRAISDAEKPALLGILLRGERYVIRKAGLLGLGVQGGIYFSKIAGPYENMFPGFISIGPFAEYQFIYIPRQWVVPVAKFQYEYIRHNYKFQGIKMQGARFMPRFEVGLWLFLNIFEPIVASESYSANGVRRTYLTAMYSVANDSSKTSGLDLSERSLRLGINFEL